MIIRMNRVQINSFLTGYFSLVGTNVGKANVSKGNKTLFLSEY